MGMFDHIVCNQDLPGILPSWYRPGHQFQSKSLGCTMDQYVILKDGSFSISDWTGDVLFYDGNACGGWGEFGFTPDGEDSENVEYKATVVNGKVTQLIQTEYTRTRALPISIMNWQPLRLADENPLPDMPGVGGSLYLLYGGHDTGEEATVVAIGPEVPKWPKWKREYCVQIKDPTYESLKVIHGGDWGRVVWPDHATAMAHRARENGIQEARRAHFLEVLRAKDEVKSE